VKLIGVHRGPIARLSFKVVDKRILGTRGKVDVRSAFRFCAGSEEKCRGKLVAFATGSCVD
jgi:hypothetical protein